MIRYLVSADKTRIRHSHYKIKDKKYVNCDRFLFSEQLRMLEYEDGSSVSQPAPASVYGFG